ncbi:MAG: ChbG/HpnK family deacetylase [Planctomycetes bacterium]|nr:ChbG/HpnK family deacetylase [Planctomycetota bacterium]
MYTVFLRPPETLDWKPRTKAAAGRRMVLHADDYGMNVAVTDGILAGFRHGLLTSTAILANAPDCPRALSLWRSLQLECAAGELPSRDARRALHDNCAAFDLGVHLNLTQGRPVTGSRYPAELLDVEGRFPGIGGVARRILMGGSKYRAGLERELKAQIEVVLDQGIRPGHLNSHQYVDTFPVVASLIPSLASRYGIGIVRVPAERGLVQSTLISKFEPANWCLAQVKAVFARWQRHTVGQRGLAFPHSFFGASHAGRVDATTFQCFLAALTPGLTEIGLHPGVRPTAGDPDQEAVVIQDGWHDPLAQLRPAELDLLTSEDLVTLLLRNHVRLGRLHELEARKTLRAAA